MKTRADPKGDVDMKKTGVAIALVLAALLAISAKNSFSGKATAEEFFAWQKESRAFLSDVLYNGQPPESVPLNPEYGAKQERDGYTLVEVKFSDRPGHKTFGRLARPTSPAAEKLPAVLALHGHSPTEMGCFDPGHMYYYGDLLAKKGYIVLAIGIDHDDLDHDKPFRSMIMLPRNVPFPAMGQRVWMSRRAVDFLQSLPDVDPEKIAVVGLSNGGLTTMFVAAMDERIGLAVSSGSLIMHSRMWHRELVHCRCQYLDQMDGALDYYDVFALAAPRPLIVQNGRRDSGFPVGSAEKAFAHIKRAYEIAGAPEKVFHDVHDGAHEFRSQVPLMWFEKYMPIGGGEDK
jgi:dienelactone hydrolase